jgi:chorismate synthase
VSHGESLLVVVAFLAGGVVVSIAKRQQQLRLERRSSGAISVL